MKNLLVRFSYESLAFGNLVYSELGSLRVDIWFISICGFTQLATTIGVISLISFL